MELRSKTVVLTGASSGLGRAAALAFARRGCRLVLAARRQDKLQETADAITQSGGKCICVPTDVTREPDVVHLFDEAEKHFGSVDVLVNNAGRGLQADLEQTTLDDWQSILSTNVTGVFLCTREAVKRMRAQNRPGCIITVSSIAGLYGGSHYGAYCASKHAVTGLMRSVKWETRKQGIRVHTIYPARIDTEFFHSYSTKPTPRQMLSPQDVAASIIAAASGNLLARCAVWTANSCKRLIRFMR